MTSTELHFTVMSGAGNRFAVFDGFRTPLPQDPAAIAIELCSSAARERHAERLDGLIVIGPPTKSAACTMWIFNADGSRPETCGNGLRCVAKLVADRGHVTQDSFTILTDAGARACTVIKRDGRVEAARVHMGAPRMIAEDRALNVRSGLVTASIVEIGNPHCVLMVGDERTAPVTTLGRELETLDVFPRGINVGFLACRAEGAFLRVWERGVGETRACGSGACAAAYAACMKGILRWPVRLKLPGGMLEVDSDGRGGVVLTGPVEEEGSITAPISISTRTTAAAAGTPAVACSPRRMHAGVDETGAVPD